MTDFISEVRLHGPYFISDTYSLCIFQDKGSELECLFIRADDCRLCG